MRLSRTLPVLSPQPTGPSAEVLALRTSWKWAYLSHFLFTYNPMLHLEDIQLSELEDDLASGTFEVIPTVMQRLLISLTPHDKRMILDNWQHQLRRQSLRRAPDSNLMGTEDEPVDFSSLIMSDKLDVFQSLCEWQFHNPNNLRARMKEDDDWANWRIEPIAYDAKGNAYWLMGGNRLWVQHIPPRKRAANRSHKRKQPATTSNGRKSKPAKRSSAAATSMGSSSSKAINSTSANSKSKSVATTPSGRPMRGARTRAAMVGSSSQQRPRTTGTRVSTRLRGKEEEEVWQPIPEEWLKEESHQDNVDEVLHDDHQTNGKGKASDPKMELPMKALDDVSELTSLSDLSDIEEDDREDEDDDEEERQEKDDSTPTPVPEFSSSGEETWETVCVTLAEWEAFPQRFQESTHRGEKAFYKLLTNDIVPMITEVLRTDVRKKVMEEAVVHRKRSSRIAVKESVREAERAAAKRKADEEKELERHKRWEARARKEEEERIRKENARSVRIRERARMGSESMDIDVVGSLSDNNPPATNDIPPSAPPPLATPVKFVVNTAKSGTQTPKDDEPWELDCEICHKQGMNLDEGQELMCCERCNKWQHIRCHDQADFVAGRPRRNWELVDFLCAVCAGRAHPPQSSSSHQQQRSHYPPHVQARSQNNGTTSLPTNGVVSTLHHQSRPEHRTSAPVKSAFKQQVAYEATPYGAGRTSYALPQPPAQQPYTAPAAAQTQHAQRHPPTATATGRTAYPSTAPSGAHAQTTVPYTSTPNMYLSNYSGGYRMPPNSHNPVAQQQPQQLPSSSHYSVVRGQAAMPSSHTGSWSQQPTQYSQMTNHQAWNGARHDSGSPYSASGTSAPQAYEQPQQNGYYHPHPAPTNHLAQQHHLTSPQPYYTGGPTSKS